MLTFICSKSPGLSLEAIFNDVRQFVQNANAQIGNRQVAFVEMCGRCSRTSIAHQLFLFYKAAGTFCREQGRAKASIKTVDGNAYDLDFSVAEPPPGLSGRVEQPSTPNSSLLPFVVPVFMLAAAQLCRIAQRHAEDNKCQYDCAMYIDYPSGETWDTFISGLGNPEGWWGAPEITVLVNALGFAAIKLMYVHDSKLTTEAAHLTPAK